MSSLLTDQQEVKIMVLLARGENKAEIARIFEKEEKRPIAVATIGAVAKRNAAVLTKIKNAKAIHEITAAEQITIRANRIISTSLMISDIQAQAMVRVGKQYLDGEITFKEYDEFQKRYKKPSLTELVTVSKEMNNQSKGDEAPPANMDEQNAIAIALQEGDEVKLTQLVFKKGGTTDAVSQHSPQ